MLGSESLRSAPLGASGVGSLSPTAFSSGEYINGELRMQSSYCVLRGRSHYNTRRRDKSQGSMERIQSEAN